MKDWPDQNDSPQSGKALRIEFAVILAILIAGIMVSFI